MRLTPVVVAVLVLVAIAQAASGSSAANNGIYKVRLDGTHRTRLFANPNLPVVQDLSPNRKRVLAQYSGQNDELYSAAIDGSHVRLVARLPGNRYVDRAVFSADGKRIAIGVVDTPCETCMSFEIWLVKSNGTGLRRLVTAGLAPSWSPDGRRIAYVGSLRPFDVQEGTVSVVNTVGTPIERAVRPPEHGDYSDWAVAWSPRGDWIAFDGLLLLRALDHADRPSVRQRARPNNRGRARGRSPAGDRLAYWDHGSKKLTTLNPDSGRRLALSFGLDRDPVAWSPNGRWIAFVRRVSKNCYQLFAVRSSEGPHR